MASVSSQLDNNVMACFCFNTVMEQIVSDGIINDKTKAMFFLSDNRAWLKKVIDKYSRVYDVHVF